MVADGTNRCPRAGKFGNERRSGGKRFWHRITLYRRIGNRIL